MLAALTLVGALAVNFTADKVNFSHNLTPGTVLAYDLTLEGNTDTGDMKLVGTFNWTYGEKSEAGIKESAKSENVKMSMNGQEMNGTDDLQASMSTVIDKNGMPETVNMDGPSAFGVVAHLLTYLPAQELEPGQDFTVDWKKGDSTLKGTGKFEGLETVEGKSLAKLTIKATFSPKGGGGDDSADLGYTVYFDPVAGHVQSASGKATVNNGEFKLSLKRTK